MEWYNMTNIEKGKRIKNCVEAIEKLEKANFMLCDRGYRSPSVSIHIHRTNQVGTTEEVVIDANCMRDIIHKAIKEMKDTNSKNLDKLLESNE